MSDTDNQTVVAPQAQQTPTLAEFVSYENNTVTLKVHPGILINAFLFLGGGAPVQPKETTEVPEYLTKLNRYTDVLNIFSDLASLSQQSLDSDRLAAEAAAKVETAPIEPTAPTEPEVSDEPFTSKKPVIKAEVVEDGENVVEASA